MDLLKVKFYWHIIKLIPFKGRVHFYVVILMVAVPHFAIKLT